MRPIAALLLAVAGVLACSFTAPSDDALMGDCGHGACGANPRVVAWLAPQRSGYCATKRNEAVALCISSSPIFQDDNEEGILCLDDERRGRAFLRRPYPNGIALDIGFHYDGARDGNVVTLGSSDRLSLLCDPALPGRRIEIGIDALGVAWAAGPETLTLRDRTPLRPGAHLVSYRVTATSNAFFIDGRRVGVGKGTDGITVEFPERWAPAFVLGAHNQRWWSCPTAGPSRWLRMAAFFVHLRDEVGDALDFDFDRAITPGDSTVLLFTPQGVVGQSWFVSAGVTSDSWNEKERNLFAGRAYGPVWHDDVWRDCLTPP